jgi:hypothetical protein
VKDFGKSFYHDYAWILVGTNYPISVEEDFTRKNKIEK